MGRHLYGTHTRTHTHTHTHTHSMLYSASSHGFLTQHICLYGGDRWAQHQSYSLTFHQPQYTRSICNRYQYLWSAPQALLSGVCMSVCTEAASIPARLHSGILWPRRSYQERKKRRQTWKRDNTTRLKERVFNLTSVCVRAHTHTQTDKPSAVFPLRTTEVVFWLCEESHPAPKQEITINPSSVASVI